MTTLLESLQVTLRALGHMLNDDDRWFGLLRDIQQHFRYTTLTSNELIAYINQRTGNDYTYFFDQYLKHTTLPLLELTFDRGGK